MPRSTSNQWDFGELFPAASTRAVWSVSETTQRIKKLLEEDFPPLWVRGELSNLRLQSSGHAYFAIKDAGAQLSCVLFRGQPGIDRGLLRDGACVILGGALTVYEARGQYQLRVTSVEPQGIGALQVAFERLKQKLAAEGLFAPERKRPIPRYPIRIGLVTSATGAAIQDVLHVIGRRHPRLEIVLVSCRVQGAGAALGIAAGIECLNRWSSRPERGSKLDAILLTRGGGSLEDLWEFNEESLARAIVASRIPVISAVGHEIDFTIADFVADLRAATPSAAAEILTQHYVNSREFVADAARILSGRVHRRHARLGNLARDLARRIQRMHPRRRLETYGQQLDDLVDDLVSRSRLARRGRESALLSLRRRLTWTQPFVSIARRRERLARVTDLLLARARERLTGLGNHFTQLESALRLLSPQSVLDRGYSITRDAESGAVVRRAADVRPGQRLLTRVAAGEIPSTVEAGPAATGP